MNERPTPYELEILCAETKEEREEIKDKYASLDKVAPLFWALVVKSEGCWLWQGGRRGDYGVFSFLGRSWAAHRLSWELSYGKPPGEYYICHKCDTPLCVNPGHLFMGTLADNMHDKIVKGRNCRMQGSRHGRAKLVESQVVIIRDLVAKGVPQGAIASVLGLSASTVSSIVRRCRWTHI